MTWTIYINFCSPFPRRLHIKFGFDWQSGFRGEDGLNIVDDDDDDDDDNDDDNGSQSKGILTISSPCEPDGLGELIILMFV